MLPVYVPSCPPPAYTLAPASGECVLEFTPGSRRRPTSTYTKRDGRTSVILHDQDDGAQMPYYGRRSIIDGLVYFENPTLVTDVIIKLEGNLKIVVPSVMSQCQRVVNQVYVLYSRATHGSCPNALPFAFPFPATFSEDDRHRQYACPPSFEMLYIGETGFYAKARYQLMVSISKNCAHLPLSRMKTISIPLRYYPRTRPELPNVEEPYLLQSIKATPEDWRQSSVQLEPLEGTKLSKLSPISVEFFIPSTQIFALSDTIPFHIQLLGEVHNLRALLPQLTQEVYPPHTGPISKSSSKPFIHVYIMRQLIVEHQGEISSRSSIIIGDGVLTALPPPITSLRCAEFHLDWMGEVKCNADISVGSFSTVNLVIRDYVVLRITPGEAKTVPYGRLQLAVPIRIVTDAWSPGAYTV